MATLPEVAAIVEPCDREAVVVRRDDIVSQGSSTGECSVVCTII